jgi:hypothetical protein
VLLIMWLDEVPHESDAAHFFYIYRKDLYICSAKG